ATRSPTATCTPVTTRPGIAAIQPVLQRPACPPATPHTPPAVVRPPPLAPRPPLRAPIHDPATPSRSRPTRCGSHAPSPAGPSAPDIPPSLRADTAPHLPCDITGPRPP